MALSESEFFEAGMSLPPSARRDLALRLLESVEVDVAVGGPAEEWLSIEAAAAYDSFELTAYRRDTAS